VTTTITIGGHGNRVIVAAPGAREPERLSFELAAVLARAAREDARAWVLPRGVPDALLAFQPAAGQRPAAPTVLHGLWWRARWEAADLERRLRRRRRSAASGFWIEMYRELRRHAGDARLPYTVRTTLREAGRRAMDRAQRADAATSAGAVPRRLVRDMPRVALPPGLQDRARLAATSRGIDVNRPFVVVEPACEPRMQAAAATLAGAGHQLLTLEADAVHRSTDDAYLVQRAAFVVCESLTMQAAAYVTSTPCLLLNAVDPLAAYPIRENGLFTLAVAVELATGRALSAAEMLGEPYLRNPSRYAQRRNSEEQVAASVREMLDVVAARAPETEAQREYRRRVEEAGAVLPARVPRLAAWAADEGFIGDGRLAAWQAEPVA
jgi:hypothetical protein